MTSFIFNVETFVSWKIFASQPITKKVRIDCDARVIVTHHEILHGISTLQKMLPGLVQTQLLRSTFDCLMKSLALNEKKTLRTTDEIFLLDLPCVNGVASSR